MYNLRMTGDVCGIVTYKNTLKGGTGMTNKGFRRIMALALASTMVVGSAVPALAKKKDEVKLTEAGYPIVPEGEELTLTCFTMTMPNVENFETNDFTKYLEEQTGVHIEWVTAGRDDWQEKLNMMLASGDYPDLMLGLSPDLA